MSVVVSEFLLFVCSPLQKKQTLWFRFLSPILLTLSGWWPARRLRGPGLNRFTQHCGESCNPRFGILTVAERGAMQRKLLRWNSVLHLYTLTQQAVAVTLQGVMRKWLYGRLLTSWQSLTWQVQSAWVSGLCLHTAVPHVALSSFQEQRVAGWRWTFYNEFNLESICSAGAICCTVKGQLWRLYDQSFMDVFVWLRWKLSLLLKLLMVNCNCLNEYYRIWRILWRLLNELIKSKNLWTAVAVNS